MAPSHVIPGTTEIPGTNLERDRLTRRARRVAAVISALRQLAGGQDADADGGERHVHQAIKEYEAEVATINARLNELGAADTPARRPHDPPRELKTT
jgi:hypothetical protein